MRIIVMVCRSSGVEHDGIATEVPESPATETTVAKEPSDIGLIEFACTIDVPGRPMSADPEEQSFAKIETALAAHHRLLLQTIERVVKTPHGRAMVLMPPGSAKSTYCSVVLPAYLMGRGPGHRVILASYGTDLARRHGRRARAIVRSERYGELFHTALSREQSAADSFALTNGSEYMATGIQAAVTGNRANGLIIDDPVKGRDAADSEPIRRKTREGYEDDLKTRLLPGGFIILIQTRWHEDDLAGSILPTGWDGESGLLKCRDGATWEVLCLPAKCDRADDPLGRRIGEYLWPEWFDRAHWAQFESNPRTWSALYQQKPSPDTGIFFEARWLKSYDAMPDREALRIYGASDYAVTDGGGDYTVHIVVGVDPAGRMHVLDLWRGQTASDVWIDVLAELVRRWKPLAWAEEAGQIRAGVGPFLEQRLRERQAYVARRQFPARGNKEVRAQSIRGRMALDGLFLPTSAQVTGGGPLALPALRGTDFGRAPPALLALRHEGFVAPPRPQSERGTLAEFAIVPLEQARASDDLDADMPAMPAKEEWVAAFRRELLQFPHGRHDDQVDALSLIGQLLDIMVRGSAPVAGAAGSNGLTLEDAWSKCRPKQWQPGGRI
jgi:phage terminase large subunit-like protein